MQFYGTGDKGGVWQDTRYSSHIHLIRALPDCTLGIFKLCRGLTVMDADLGPISSFAESYPVLMVGMQMLLIRLLIYEVG
jgi:hypothetical protein